MATLSDVVEKQKQQIRITCPVWHSPLLFVVSDGLLIKCKSCRKEMHLVSRAEIERIWNEMEQENTIIATEKPAI